MRKVREEAQKKPAAFRKHPCVSGRDPRINAPYPWVKTTLFLLISLLIVNTGHVLIYQEIFGIESTVANLLVPELLMYTIFASFVLAALMGIMRNSHVNEPMRRLSAAAKQVAEGDYAIRLAPMREDGKKDYVEVMFEDFNKMTEELASTETLKSDFIINVSHEIKSPLSVIQTYAGAVKGEHLTPEERSEYADTIISASQKMTALVTDILKMSKLENQEILPLAEEYDLSEQLKECLLSCEQVWEEKGLNIQVDIEDNVIVRYDRSMLEIVWNNLISNAIKFTKAGGSISVSLIPASSGYAIVSVSDTGCGMDAQTQKHIFDKFYQGDTSHSSEGNGLGLALAAKAVELLGGDISVHSRLGAGTVFTVRLKM